MILKIHLIISILAYIFFWLTMQRMIGAYIKVNKDKELKNKSIGFINHIRLTIIILIPLLNIMMFLIYANMFCFKDDDELLEILSKNL